PLPPRRREGGDRRQREDRAHPTPRIAWSNPPSTHGLRDPARAVRRAPRDLRSQGRATSLPAQDRLALLHHERDVFRAPDVGEQIALHRDEVRELSGTEHPYASV